MFIPLITMRIFRKQMLLLGTGQIVIFDWDEIAITTRALECLSDAVNSTNSFFLFKKNIHVPFNCKIFLNDCYINLKCF